MKSGCAAVVAVAVLRVGTVSLPTVVVPMLVTWRISLPKRMKYGIEVGSSSLAIIGIAVAPMLIAPAKRPMPGGK